MNKGQIAKRYSKTLVHMFDVADIPKILEGVNIFSRLIDVDKNIKILFASRIFSEEEKDKALKALQLHLKASEHTERFLRLIIINGHLSALKEIIKASVVAYNEKMKKMSATVISSVSLGKNYVDRLSSALKALSKRDIDIETRVDPSLLGGFIVKMGSTIYDSSLKGQLRLLRAELVR